MSRRTPASAPNEGIQANAVTADVLAVGRGARAEKIVYGSDDQLALRDAIGALRQTLDSRNLPPPERQKVEVEVAGLERAAAAMDPEKTRSRLSDLMATLKAVGIAVSDVAALIGPITRVLGL